MSGTKTPNVESKYIRRTREKLARRVKLFEEALARLVKEKGNPRGLHRPGSQNPRKAG